MPWPARANHPRHDRASAAGRRLQRGHRIPDRLVQRCVGDIRSPLTHRQPASLSWRAEEANTFARRRTQHRVVEADAVGRVGIEKVPDTTAQDGTDQDAGIEYDHLIEMGSWIDDAVV